MSDDYLWDRSGAPDPDIKRLEELLAPLAYDAPLDELRLAKGRRGAIARATAQEPVAAPPESGRTKGKMNIFDKRIIGAATLTAAALGLLGVTVYKRSGESVGRSVFTPSQREALAMGESLTRSIYANREGFIPPPIAIGRTFAGTPRAAPVAPTMGADLAITAGESAWIHVPFGVVDVEIQSTCNAEVELAVITALLNEFVPLGAPPVVSTQATGGVIVGKDSADGRASTYHLTPGLDPGDGMYEYTSRCVGQPPIRGRIVVDRVDVRDPIGASTNARVYSNMTSAEHLRVFGDVSPDAIVSVGARQIALEPADPSGADRSSLSTFATEVPVALDHLVATARVDDAKGTHFYVMHGSAQEVVASCATSMTAPKQTAATLGAQGDYAGALRALEAAMAECKPDRETLALVLEYACKAGDAGAARKYWRKLPRELQSTVEPVCATNKITRDVLDRP